MEACPISRPTWVVFSKLSDQGHISDTTLFEAPQMKLVMAQKMMPALTFKMPCGSFGLKLLALSSMQPPHTNVVCCKESAHRTTLEWQKQ